MPGLAVTLFSLLLELHKDEEMARNSVVEAVRLAIRQHMHDSSGKKQTGTSMYQLSDVNNQV